MNRSLNTTGGLPLMILLLAISLLSSPAIAQMFEIGHTSITYVDPARGNRQIPTEIFYPADVGGEDVPVAGEPGVRFSSVCIGHGFLIPWGDYQYLWEGLVPEGFIVLLPDTEGGFAPDHLDFGLDLAYVLGALLDDGEDPASLFFEKISLASGIAGHSMGGGASLLGAASDPSIAAVANLAAAETNPSAIAAAFSITVPALLFSGSNDCVTPPEDHQIPMYEALASPCRTYISVTGGSHCQFAEPNGLCSAGELFCSPPDITRAAQQETVLDYLLPWLQFSLEADLNAWSGFQSLLETDNRVTSLQDCEVVAVPEPTPGAEPGRASMVLRLEPPVPNPTSGPTAVWFELIRPGRVTLDIVDVSGRTVCNLLARELQPGGHDTTWDGLDDRARSVAAGVYFVRARFHGQSLTRRLTLIR